MSNAFIFDDSMHLISSWFLIYWHISIETFTKHTFVWNEYKKEHKYCHFYWVQASNVWNNYFRWVTSVRTWKGVKFLSVRIFSYDIWWRDVLEKLIKINICRRWYIWLCLSWIRSVLVNTFFKFIYVYSYFTIRQYPGSSIVPLECFRASKIDK